MKTHSLTLAILVFLSWALNSVVVNASPVFPRLNGHVVDRAKLLTRAQNKSLTKQLKAHEKKSSDQVVIVTLPSLQGYSIGQFALELGRHWKIGQKDKNNGVLLVIAPKEKKVRIEVGYGLEGTLTDSLSQLIIKQAIVPAYKKGEIYQAIQKGTDEILAVLSGNAKDVKARLKPIAKPMPWFIKMILFGFLGVIALAIIKSFMPVSEEERRRRQKRALLHKTSKNTDQDSSTKSSRTVSKRRRWSGRGGDFGGGGSSGDL